MTSKVVRISDDALKTAQKYSEDISTAILIMNAKIEELQSITPNPDTLTEIKSLIETIRKDLPDEYTLKKTITGAVNDCFAEYTRGGF